MPAPHIETDRLVLRRFTRRDVPSLEEGVRASLADLNEWLPWAHMDYTRDDAVAFIRDSVSAWKDDKAYDYSIRASDDLNFHLGNISIWQTSRTGRIGEIGYWIRSEVAGKGFGTEATLAVMREGFRSMNLHKIVLRIAVGNLGSERIAEKLGFHREGVLREELLIRGNWIDHTLFSILDREHRRLHGR